MAKEENSVPSAKSTQSGSGRAAKHEPDLSPGYFLELLEAIGTSLEQAYANANPLPSGYQRVIRQLFRQDGQTQTELANALHVHKVSIGLYVNELEEMGLVERRPHPTDGRAKRICLTDYLRKFRPEGERVFADIHRHAIEGLPTEDYRFLLRGMEKMRANLENLVRAPGALKPINPPEPDTRPGDKAAAAPPRRKKTP